MSNFPKFKFGYVMPSSRIVRKRIKTRKKMMSFWIENDYGKVNKVRYETKEEAYKEETGKDAAYGDAEFYNWLASHQYPNIEPKNQFWEEKTYESKIRSNCTFNPKTKEFESTDQHLEEYAERKRCDNGLFEICIDEKEEIRGYSALGRWVELDLPPYDFADSNYDIEDAKSAKSREDQFKNAKKTKPKSFGGKIRDFGNKGEKNE